MRTCLVVDDSSVIRKVARRILEGLDFQIVEAEDGEKALEVCKRGLPDAILLDWNMPIMDGYEFLRNLRRTPARHAPQPASSTPAPAAPPTPRPLPPPPTPHRPPPPPPPRVP